MTTVLWLLALLGALGAFDTLYFHEWRGRLAARGEGIRVELGLHAGRDAVYAVIFGTLPWLEWRGAWTIVLGGLIAAEMVITFTDFVVEDRVRRPLGGVYPGERVTHAMMAIVYGSILTTLVPELGAWLHEPTGLVTSRTTSPLLLRVTLTALSAGVVASGVRDLLAAVAVPGSAWPWRPVDQPPSETAATTAATAREPVTLPLSTAIGLFAFAVHARRRR